MFVGVSVPICSGIIRNLIYRHVQAVCFSQWFYLGLGHVPSSESLIESLSIYLYIDLIALV